ncbi:BamA/TamA family outer membrane protein [Sediminitomix flava]|uniref:Outer membrane protein assembly factor BamA n=1 Tax=Sediminitomix flava TaxID=379075 RepID=A0A316A3V5_SEDFL|nr:hypothetical protein [Sediminitomix flava]PWJ44417.1 hypothetical protein BC781_101776 [Sediminitomix flava]
MNSLSFKSSKKIILLIILLFETLLGFAQDDSLKVYQTIRVRAYQSIVIGDSVYSFERDTVLEVPVDMEYSFDSLDVERTEQFLDSLKIKADQSRVGRQLYSWFFDRSNNKPAKVRDSRREEYWTAYEGKIIKDVEIIRLPPFGTSVDGYSRASVDRFEAWANKIHTLTRRHVVRNNLIVKKGEKVVAAKMYDSERLIRQLSFIKDARINLFPTQSEDSVSLQIVTKDQWAIIPVGSYGSTSRFDFGLRHGNIAGLGHRLTLEGVYRGDEPPNLGVDIEYEIVNIGGSFIRLEGDYESHADRELQGIRLEREFFSPLTKYAGGVGGRYELRRRALEIDTLGNRMDTEGTFADAWFGRAYKLSNEYNYRLITSVGFNRQNYTIRPAVEENLNYNYHNYDQYLANIGVSDRKFYVTSLVRGFGRTEDIPLGHLLQFTGGYENGEFEDRYYGAVTVASGQKNKKGGYYRAELNLGSFIDSARLDQGVINVELVHFSRLFRKGDWNFRYFINLNYLNGINRFESDSVILNRDVGLNNVRSRELFGKKRAVVEPEIVFFSPYQFYGFKIAFFGFWSVGTIAQNTSDSIFKSPRYHSLGFGLRTLNENLSINILELEIGYIPNDIPEQSKFSIRLSTSIPFEIKGFESRRPEIIPYR